VARRPERAPGDLPGQVHALEATLESFGDVVVTTLVLYRPGIRPGGDRGAEPAPPLDLRL
jgi:hypothetical protein